MKGGSSMLGCATLLALGLAVFGGTLVAFSYWWDAGHPTGFMKPRWDSLLLVLAPLLIGVVAVGVGSLVAFVAFIAWIMGKLRERAED